ncbi:hypothetical protein PHLH6_53030 [Pseudomonas sp. Seg1]|nr:hypothetical protein PHLH6_53030 [Pseudomonas sp. Seg1]
MEWRVRSRLFYMSAVMTDLSLVALPGGLPDKRQVAASFSRAAASYDSVAELQRDVGTQLLQRLPAGFSPSRWMDLGCGTGYFTRALAERFTGRQGLALDIAEGMLEHARPLGGAEHFIAGDAERLPLQDGTCDLIFSSLAVQWCAEFDSVLSEAFRVLKPGGFSRLLVFVSERCTNCVIAGVRSMAWCTSTVSASSPAMSSCVRPVDCAR